MWQIVEYYAENFKNLRFVNFKPTGPLVAFTGKNDQGKTSAIDVLPYVLVGKKWKGFPEMPLRRGAERLTCKLTLRNGENASFTVVRTDKSPVKIEPGPGCKVWGTPQDMLDDILDVLSFDPLEFIRKGKNADGRREQVQMLRAALVLDVDPEQIKTDNDADYKARTLINRDIDRVKLEIAAIPVVPNLPDAPIDMAAIDAKIRAMDEHSEPTHVSPVFLDLLQRQFLPRAGLRLREHLLFPMDGFQLTRKPLAWLFSLAALPFSGHAIVGDNHILVLEVSP